MTNMRASDALNKLVVDLTSWVNSASFQRIFNGKQGSAEAQNLYAAILGLAAIPTESQLSDVLQLATELNKARKPFRHPYAFALLELRLICGRYCSKFISETSIAEGEHFYATKVLSFKNPILTEQILIHRTGNPDQDIVYIDLDKFDRTKFELSLTASGTTLPFQLVAALYQKKTERVLIVIDKDLSIPAVRVEAYIRALSLNQGKSFDTPKKYTGTSVIRSFSSPTPQQPLEQFNDAHQVLSESFREDDLLNRFLRLFQVLENFMVRRQIIKVQRATGVRTFSIRDFRRLYGETGANESEALTELFKEALDIPTLINSQALHQIIKVRWDNEIHLSTNQAKLAHHLLMYYGPSAKHSVIFDTSKFSSQLGKAGERHTTLGPFVYRFRNMIVHNKETEFHLTHSSITSEIETVLNKFLLPTLDDIVFALLNIDHNVIWYPHSTISLYKS